MLHLLRKSNCQDAKFIAKDAKEIAFQKKSLRFILRALAVNFKPQMKSDVPHIELPY